MEGFEAGERERERGREVSVARGVEEERRSGERQTERREGEGLRR